MYDIVGHVALLAEHAASLPRLLAWAALFGTLLIWASGRRGWVYAGLSFALIGATLAIVGLPMRAYDPVAWGTLVGGLFLGAGINWSRSTAWHWGWALSVCVLAVVLALYILKLPADDAEALILIGLAGSSAGDWLPSLGKGEARSA